MNNTKHTLTIPAGTDTGHIQRIIGAGLPHYSPKMKYQSPSSSKSSTCGDLVVTFEVHIGEVTTKMRDKLSSMLASPGTSRQVKPFGIE
ncbi:unnamed protein product [Protopolystoma xenopodis]|uniref:Chaperone DnaJ C-terminal domain-containing protein n=1 Tax=Protopolystoma xenopodis TaxID=117903 RepID=A0A3S5A278_9PLAT|nr:unnamed protein product [Protopolystoma xenopodis]